MITRESTRVSTGQSNELERMGATEILNDKETSLVFFIVEHRWANVFSKESDSKHFQLVNIFSLVGQSL